MHKKMLSTTKYFVTIFTSNFIINHMEKLSPKNLFNFFLKEIAESQLITASIVCPPKIRRKSSINQTKSQFPDLTSSFLPT